MVLETTLTAMMSEVAIFERQRATADASGGIRKRDWTLLSKTECRLWWWKGSKSSDKSPSAQFARPQATIDVTGGDMMLPLGTDVTEEDRLARVTDEEGNVREEGPFRIVAVNTYETHIELSLERP
jgi:hypothetical protein